MKKDSIINKYTYRLEWSYSDNTHIARCMEFPTLRAHGSTAKKALREIEKVVEETINWMREDGEVIPEPFGTKQFKENLTVRVPVAACNG